MPLPVIVPVESLGTENNLYVRMRSSSGCRYSAAVSLYSARTGTVEGTLLSALDTRLLALIQWYSIEPALSQQS